jgi:hypothetical protein
MTVPNVGRSTKPAPDSSPDDRARGQSGDIVEMPREALQALIHDLRNHLNSILMNAGVAARLCEDRERVARYVTQFEKEGELCAEALQAISDEYL